MNKVCDCYRKGYSNDYCTGTREKDWCLCGGDETKCDFYADKRRIARKEIQKGNEHQISIEITKLQAESMCDFLEAEFINGIGSDKDVKDNEYVKGIRAVYDKLQEVCRNNA